MRWAIRFIGVISTLILARLLSPEDFGIAAMGSLVIGLLFSVTESGAASLLIRTKEFDQAHCDTAWTISLLQNIVVGLLIIILAPVAAVYFNEPRIIEVMYILAIVVLVGGLGSISPTLIRRELKFDLDFRFNIYKKLAVFFPTVGLAIWLGNYWALIFGILIGTIINVLISYAIHPYRPSFSFVRSLEYLRFALSIIPMQIAYKLHEMAPKFIIGGIGNANIMGNFTVSSDLATSFTHEIVSPIGRGLYPNYARLMDDRDQLTKFYIKILGVIILLVIPMGVGVSVTAADLVATLLGEKWGMAVPLVEYLAFSGILYAITFVMYNQILVAAGRERQAAILAWVRLFITVPILWLGLSFEGVLGLTKATVVAPLIYLPLVYYEIRQVVNLSVLTVVRISWRPILGAVVMYLSVELFHLESVDWAILRLISDAMFGAGVYTITVVGLWVLSGRPQGVEHMSINLVRKKLNKVRMDWSTKCSSNKV
jgi:O-antigen/teichoic acid export membrane protein